MSPNKFLKLYPQLRDPDIGDKIKIVQVLNARKCPVDKWYYSINDVGTLVYINSTESVYEIYFELYANSFPVYREEFEII
jgi:hypothetical protein